MVWRPIWRCPDEDISVYIFNASAQMVGLSMAVIGILDTDPHMGSQIRPRDFLLVAVVLLFLSSALSSYIAMRNRKFQRRHKLEIFSECSFALGLLLMVLICLFISLELV